MRFDMSQEVRGLVVAQAAARAMCPPNCGSQKKKLDHVANPGTIIILLIKENKLTK
jgi:hypothetical protein